MARRKSNSECTIKALFAKSRNMCNFAAASRGDAQSLPDRVPHILEKGSDKVAYDILKQLVDGPRRPAELRAALGIASANFFTARYLTPLAKSGYIAVAGGEKNRYLPGKQYSGRHVGGLDFGERDPFDEGFDRDV